jgi:arabinofuranan 3-O-arabinosyltransferase
MNRTICPVLRQISRYAPWFLLAAAVSTLALSANGADFYASAAWMSALVWSFARRRDPDTAPIEQFSHKKAPIWAATVVGGAVAALWFSPGKFYAFGDRTPLVRDTASSNLLSPWNNLYSGGGNITWDITRVAEVFFYKVGTFVNDPSVGQRVFTALVFAYAAYAASSLFSRLLRSNVLSAAGGVLVAFSPLVMVTLPNYLHVIVSGVTCVAIRHFLDLRNGNKPGRYSLFLVTFPIFLVGTNPPLTVIALTFLALSPLLSLLFSSAKLNARRAAKHVAVALSLHSWWAVPVFVTAFVARAEGTTDTVLDPSRWSWASSKSGVANLTTGAANWSWPRGEYFGSAVEAAQPWFSWALWIIPLLFFVSFTDRYNGGRLARRVVFICAPLLIVAKGLHSPLSGLNSWMYNNLPGFWLLRQPTTKIWWLLWILVVVVALRTLDRIAPTARSFFSGRVKITYLVLAASFLPVWPLFTGASAVSSPRSEWPSHRVSVPKDWYALGDHMKDEKGAVISLPLADFYMMPTTWGFYGWDNIARNVISKPVFSLTDESYIGNTAGLSAVIRKFEESILARDSAGVKSLSRDMGLGSVLVRKDYDIESAVREVSIKDYRDVERSLASLGAERTFNSDSVSVWRLPWEVSSSYATRNYVFAPKELTPDEVASVAVSAGDATVISSKDNKDTPMVDIDSRQVSIKESYVLKRTGDSTVYDLSINDGFVTLSEATVLTSPSGQMEKRVFRIAPGEGVRIDGVWRKAGSRVGLPLGNTQMEVLSFDTALTPVGGISPLADCNKSDNAPLSDTGLYIKEQGSYLELGAKIHSACINWESNIERGVEYLVELEGERLSGRLPRWCIQQTVDNNKVCVPIHDVRVSGNNFYASTIITGRQSPAVKIYAYADGATTGTSSATKIRYKVPSIRRATTVSLTDVTVSPTSHNVPAGSTTVTLPGGAVSLAPFSQAAACGGSGTIGVSGIERAESVLLSVMSGTSCMSSEVTGVTPGGVVTFSASVTGKPGAVASACILTGDSKTCDKSSVTLSEKPSLLEFRTKIPTNAFVNRLYIYVKDSGGESYAEFVDIQVSNSSPETLVAIPDSAYSGNTEYSADGMKVSINGPGKYLVFNPTSSSATWSGSGDRVTAGGWANGWMVDSSSDQYSVNPTNRVATAVQVFLLLYAVSVAVLVFGYFRDYRFSKRVRSKSDDPS